MPMPMDIPADKHQENDLKVCKKVIEKYNEILKTQPKLSDIDRTHLYFNTHKTRDGAIGMGFESRIFKPSGKQEEFFLNSLKLFSATVDRQRVGSRTHELPGLPARRYDALITIVGFSLPPLALAVLSLQPEQAYPIATEESCGFDGMDVGAYLQFIADRLFAPGNIIADRPIAAKGVPYRETHFPDYRTITVHPPLLVNAIGSMDTFTQIRVLINSIRIAKPDASIAIDVTGGKKSMDVSAFLAAAIEERTGEANAGIDIYYVDFIDYLDGRPVCGTEFLNLLDNPYSLYNVREETLLKGFWEAGDFASAQELTRSILNGFTESEARNFGLEKERARFLQLNTAAACYRAWSDFQYSAALEHKDFDAFQGRHGDRLDILFRQADIWRTAKGAVIMAIDRWMRAVDFAQKNINRGALCISQAFELLGEFRLWELCNKGHVQITVKKNHMATFELGSLTFSVTALTGFLFGQSPKVSNRPIASRPHCFIWKNKKKAFKSELVGFEQIKKACELRNQLAHFKLPASTPAAAQRFGEIDESRNTLQKYIELFILEYRHEMNGEAFNSLLEKHQFASFGHVVGNLQ